MSVPEIVEEIRTLFLFEGLADDQLVWLAERGQLRTFDAGVVVAREGEPATQLFVLLEGRLRLSRLMTGEDVAVNETDHRGTYGGAVRAYVDDAETYPGTLTAITPCRFFCLPAPAFAEFMRTSFPMAVHLLDGLYVGVRNSEAQVRQREHLASLGTLSANLAHELNNPAAAAVRATAQLRARHAEARDALHALAEAGTDPARLRRLLELQSEALRGAAGGTARLGALERADAEDEVGDRLADLGVDGAYGLAAALVAAGLGAAWLDEVAGAVAPSPPAGAVRWLTAAVETEALLDELADAATRVSQLVAAVKQYSRLDSATPVPTDLRSGLDSTVVMLGAKLAGVRVVRDYAPDLPTVPVHAAELNQVWTNLLDNAAYALGGSGTVTLRARRHGDAVVVEVADDGPGIPPDVLPRVFEAFVTTKPAGEGSGLGLDNARRVVERRHGGTITVDSSPAGTTVRVRLPLGGAA